MINISIGTLVELIIAFVTLAIIFSLEIAYALTQ